jgi:hypothetical protein
VCAAGVPVCWRPAGSTWRPVDGGRGVELEVSRRDTLAGCRGAPSLGVEAKAVRTGER